jgi:hypothetical protein
MNDVQLVVVRLISMTIVSRKLFGRMCGKSEASLREIYQIDSRGTGERILEEQGRGSWVDFLMSSPSCCQLLMNPFLKD